MAQKSLLNSSSFSCCEAYGFSQVKLLQWLDFISGMSSLSY